jgi:hypothetical protein
MDSEAESARAAKPPDETLDIGSESGSPVSADYRSRDSAFSGEVNRVQIDVDDPALDTDHLISPEERLRVVMSIQSSSTRTLRSARSPTTAISWSTQWGAGAGLVPVTRRRSVVLEAAWWGLLGACSLVVGAVIVTFRAAGRRLVGAVMGFGAGVLLSAVSFELFEKAVTTSAGTGGTGAGFFVGALTLFTGDVLISRLDGGAGPDTSPELVGVAHRSRNRARRDSRIGGARADGVADRRRRPLNAARGFHLEPARVGRRVGRPVPLRLESVSLPIVSHIRVVIIMVDVGSAFGILPSLSFLGSFGTLISG